MARKPNRNMSQVALSQHATESASKDKFAQVGSLVHGGRDELKRDKQKRVSPQLSCTISEEDKDALTDLTLYFAAKTGRILNVSNVIRALIRFGNSHKEQIDV